MTHAPALTPQLTLHRTSMHILWRTPDSSELARRSVLGGSSDTESKTTTPYSGTSFS